MEYLRQMGAVIWKDLAVEFRTRERIASMGAFTVLVGVLFNFSFDPMGFEMTTFTSRIRAFFRLCVYFWFDFR